MLVLTRKASQRIRVGENISITIVKVEGNKVRIGIEAPADVTILREEVELKDTEKHELLCSTAI